ncbi:hypothetical protein AB4Z27_05965 [Cupriavidus sp. KB_39]|uniref:STY1053 family phage-associated protein n=1 Tax=Cupriavidus sp. KB_39 TaxID=3233036 RepID=UPI003F8FE29A
MPKIYVRKAFVLQHDGGKHEFPVGNHTVPPAVAEHWFVKAHIGEEPAAGGEAGDLAEQRAALDSAGQFLEGKAKELKERQDALDMRAGTVSDREKAADQREADLNARAEALDTREVAIAEREKAADAAAKQTGKK